MSEPRSGIDAGALGLPRRSTRAAFALGRHRLGSRFGARAGALAAAGLAVGFGALMSATPHASAHGAEGMIAAALRWSAWLAVGPLGLAVAGPLGRRDREEGLTDLAHLCRLDDRALGVGRWVAAAVGASWRLVLPVSAVLLTGAARAPSAAWVALSVGGVAAALVTGVVLSGVAALCGWVSHERGRTLFLAVVVLPWLLGASSELAVWSIPGVLDEVIELFTTRGRG